MLPWVMLHEIIFSEFSRKVPEWQNFGPEDCNLSTLSNLIGTEWSVAMEKEVDFTLLNLRYMKFQYLTDSRCWKRRVQQFVNLRTVGGGKLRTQNTENSMFGKIRERWCSRTTFFPTTPSNAATVYHVPQAIGWIYRPGNSKCKIKNILLHLQSLNSNRHCYFSFKLSEVI